MFVSFGASAVLLYGAPRSPLAQPRNLIGGHLVSAVIGVSAWMLFQQYPWLAAALAVATAIAAMHLTRTLHPPGGATALIAVIGSDKIHDLGYLYVLLPATLVPWCCSWSLSWSTIFRSRGATPRSGCSGAAGRGANLARGAPRLAPMGTMNERPRVIQSQNAPRGSLEPSSASRRFQTRSCPAPRPSTPKSRPNDRGSSLAVSPA